MNGGAPQRHLIDATYYVGLQVPRNTHLNSALDALLVPETAPYPKLIPGGALRVDCKAYRVSNDAESKYADKP